MLGEYLRNHREEMGLSIADLSSRTRIRSDYLRALESEDFGKIPGEVFIKGYIREYLKTLSVDPSEALKIYSEYKKSIVVEPLQPKKVRGPQKVARLFGELVRPSIPAWLLYLLPVALIIIIPLVYFTGFKDAPNTSSVRNKTNRESVVTMIPNPVTPAEADYTNKHILKVNAVEDTWLFIQIDDSLSYSMLLRTGQEKSWTGKSKFFIKVGNAGGIRLTFDGKELGAPGKRGHVVKITLPEDLNN